ncbi:beta-N-acetylhexosaminidase [Pseudoduganella albidiflava]|uniref:beta-N-acetylhexosaminidase n=2 Tax=Pseudoduganella albidiflava TaxID=321983 RepID=A0AA87XVD8_9BURK|nr:beta-N-acetylhexosaminidase [Pseudoduganella albidiflava]GGY38469.1 beta-N-acetylhexosaminidase [Pseudoduganella albidiflava]
MRSHTLLSCTLLSCTLMLGSSCLAIPASAQEIVPRPAQIQRGQGTFTLTAATRIVATGAAAVEADKLRDYLRPTTGYSLPVVASGGDNSIRLALDPALEKLGKEGYRLVSNSTGATITAAQPAGLFYGIQTLRQLFPADIYRMAPLARTWSIPAVTIEDQPRFGWRGSHLDVARHYMPASFVLRHLELMAQQKLNVFHWHLTDDQGWRIEIKRYPKLTSIGAWRRETMVEPKNPEPARQLYDGKPHGGFYTQDDIREVVAYAAARHITVVPEIEMPGHATAAIAAYPELGNDPARQLQVGRVWGIMPEIFNVEDGTITFLKNVLDEVLTLFPGTYIHIGGDEVLKPEWAASPKALARMKQLKLVPDGTTAQELQSYRGADGKPADHPALHGLQSWFINQMNDHLKQKGRRMVGWDEILDGGLPKGATVMSWRGEEGGIKAAALGHDVVMTPERGTYLDYYQAELSDPAFREPIGARKFNLLDKVYAFDPIPATLPAAHAVRILGSQGQLWSERMPTPAQVEYMAWPRLLALSETMWTPKALKDYGDFQQRLPQALLRLQVQHVNYRPLDGPPWPK